MENKAFYKDIRLWALLGLIAFLFVHHFCGYFGHYGFDDIMGYAFYAKKWANGACFYLDENFFSYRWGFIGLTGFFYALFGMSDGSAAIFPSLVLLGTALVILWVLKGQERLVAVVAMLLYAFDNWTMYYSDKIMPDTTVALATFAAFAIIHNSRFVHQNGTTLKHALGLAALLLWAYMTKQSVLLLAPVFLILMCIDLSQKRQQKFWFQTTMACILFGLLYLWLIYLITGNPFSRFLSVEMGLEDNLGEGHAFSFCNYAKQSTAVLLYRIGFEMIERALSAGMLFSIMLALPALFSHQLKTIIYSKNETSYWALVLILSALSANFMTTSYKAYLPICPDIRHFLFLVPMAAVVGAPILTRFAKKREYKGAYMIVSFLVMLLAIYCNLGNMEYLYIGAFGAILLRSVLPNHPFVIGGFLLGMLFLLLLPILSSMHSSNQNAYVEQRTVIYTYLKDKPEKSIVYTNLIQKNFGNYLLEFNATANCQFYHYNEINQARPVNSTIYILTNEVTRQMSHFNEKKISPIIRAALDGTKNEGLEAIYQSEKVALWKLKDPSSLLHK